jgi:hypothetical protein
VNGSLSLYCVRHWCMNRVCWMNSCRSVLHWIGCAECMNRVCWKYSCRSILRWIGCAECMNRVCWMNSCRSVLHWSPFSTCVTLYLAVSIGTRISYGWHRVHFMYAAYCVSRHCSKDCVHETPRPGGPSSCHPDFLHANLTLMQAAILRFLRRRTCDSKYLYLWISVRPAASFFCRS